MGIRFSTYALVTLLVLLGAGPVAAEECCKSAASTKCCCVDVEKLEFCTPQLCADVKFQDGMTPFVSPVPDISSAILQSSVADLVDHPAFKPLLKLAPNVRRERAPPPLFADPTLCFLPPPALSW